MTHFVCIYLFKNVTHVSFVTYVTFSVSPVRSLMDSFGNLYLEDMEEYIQRAGMQNVFEESGPMTVFTPDRRALREVPNNIR